MTVQNHVTHPPIKQKRRRSPSVENVRSKRRKQSPAQSLIDAYDKQKVASTRFPPKITPQHLHTAMQMYEQAIEGACAEVEALCALCGEFKSKTELRHIPCDDKRLYGMKSSEGVLRLDSCCLMDGSYHLCPSCFNALNGGNIPKFSAMNGVNVTVCEDFPVELDDLTLTEQYAIARSHPVGTIRLSTSTCMEQYGTRTYWCGRCSMYMSPGRQVRGRQVATCTRVGPNDL